MECAWCGRKKGLLEHFTRFGFCHRCDTMVRGQLKEAQLQIALTADFCDARLLRHRLGGASEPGDADLLRRLDEALGIILDLEAVRPTIPFFKSSLDSAHTRLMLCRVVLPESAALPPPAAQSALPQGERSERHTAFCALLASLEQLPFTPHEFTKRPRRRDPATLHDLSCAQVAASSDADKLGSYVALDVKTTGPNPRRCEIIGLSAVRFEAFTPRAVFSTLMIPQRPIPPRAVRRCGVDNEMVRGMPLIDEVMPALCEFAEGSRLVGYNLLTELAFLYVYGFTPPKQPHHLYDVLPLAQSFLTAPDSLIGRTGGYKGFDLPDYSLPALCDYYNICYEERYRAGADCLSIGLLFAALVRDRTGADRKEPPPRQE